MGRIDARMTPESGWDEMRRAMALRDQYRGQAEKMRGEARERALIELRVSVSRMSFLARVRFAFGLTLDPMNVALGNPPAGS